MEPQIHPTSFSSTTAIQDLPTVPFAESWTESAISDLEVRYDVISTCQQIEQGKTIDEYVQACTPNFNQKRLPIYRSLCKFPDELLNLAGPYLSSSSQANFQRERNLRFGRLPAMERKYSRLMKASYLKPKTLFTVQMLCG